MKLLGGLLMVLLLGHQATLSLQITWQAQSGEWPQIGLQLLGTRTVSATRQRLGGSLPQGIALKLTSLITLPAMRTNVFRLLAVGLRTWPQAPAQTTCAGGDPGYSEAAPCRQTVHKQVATSLCA
eukprot:COSAG02_NODE_7052_length_3208_cov_1.044709_3_plen_125_part_00